MSLGNSRLAHWKIIFEKMQFLLSVTFFFLEDRTNCHPILGIFLPSPYLVILANQERHGSAYMGDGGPRVAL